MMTAKWKLSAAPRANHPLNLNDHHPLQLDMAAMMFHVGIVDPKPNLHHRFTPEILSIDPSFLHPQGVLT